MANEKGFVTTLMKAIRREFPTAVTWKPCDSFTLGVPDIWAGVPVATLIIAEVKQIPKLMVNTTLMDADSEKGLLRHCFTGPQVSWLRVWGKLGFEAYGIVRTHHSTAYRIHPQFIPPDGQVTPRLLFLHGEAFRRHDNWKFWKHEVS